MTDPKKTDEIKDAQKPNPKPETAKPIAPPTTTSAADMPVRETDLHLKTKQTDKQKWNDATSIPQSPIRQGETRQEANKSEGEFDTGLNEPVPEGEEFANIGKL